MYVYIERDICTHTHTHTQGFADTMGMSSVQYMIADRVVAPPENEGLFQEHLVLMPSCYHFYSVRRNRFRDDGLEVVVEDDTEGGGGSEGGGGGGRRGEGEGEGGGGHLRGSGGFLTLDAQVNTDRIEGHMWDIWVRVLSANNRTALRLRQVWLRVWVWVCGCVREKVCVCMYTYVRMCVCVCVSVCMFIYIYTFMCIYIHMCIHAYIHT